MRIGLIGPPSTGKTALFTLLTQPDRQLSQAASGRRQTNLGAIRVPDSRLDFLFNLMSPARKAEAEITCVDVVGMQRQEDRPPDDDYVRHIGEVDGFCVVIGAFLAPGDDQAAAEALQTFLFDLGYADLSKVERRIQRIRQDVARGRKEAAEELPLMERCRQLLHDERPLSELPLTPAEEAGLRGFQFLTQKPALVVANVAEDDCGRGLPALERTARERDLPYLQVCAQVELEIAKLDPAEQDTFLREYGIDQPARERFIRLVHGMFDLVTFYTCNEQETRAWPVARGTPALKAAGRVHSDMERGFIRAEVVSLDDLKAAGSLAACRAAGTLRLEGRDYPVADGDLIHFRFSV